MQMQHIKDFVGTKICMYSDLHAFIRKADLCQQQIALTKCFQKIVKSISKCIIFTALGCALGRGGGGNLSLLIPRAGNSDAAGSD